VPAILLDNQILLSLWRYWLAQRGARPMPQRSDIDPVDIPALLPHLQLVERVPPEGRYRYRLAGSAIVEAYGRELSGKYLDEIVPPHRRAIAEGHYNLVFAERHPLYVRNKYTTTRALDVTATRIILPLAGAADEIAMLLVGQTFEYGSAIPQPLDADTKNAAYEGEVLFLEA
jgi:hypothetical protein